MNMNNIDVSTWYKERCKSTLKQCSIDTVNNQYMISSELEVVNFDEVKDNICQDNTNNITSLKSVDALYFHNEQCTLYLIEFKNGKIEKNGNKRNIQSKINILEIKEKIYDSFLMLKHKDILDFKSINLNFILVYNPQKNLESNSNSAMHLARRSEQHFIRFGLNNFKNYLYDDVLTMTSRSFEEWVSKDFLKY